MEESIQYNNIVEVDMDGRGESVFSNTRGLISPFYAAEVRDIFLLYNKSIFRPIFTL